jgi:hypothetical protein
MIKGLRWLANKLQDLKCSLHLNWNWLLDKMKTECKCERSQNL